ncbi:MULTISPECIES: GntR family transcriptional regulator [unclassified Streptomyces]|uniref:winged helix-turn-helix domain-containing protein n=1 Tax=unclassified Streptomyces TaxID=2593676 RepID=UPI003D7274BE
MTTTPQNIADSLRGRIRAGELKAGDRLPTQAELAEEFGVERGAVRQALRALKEDGLLTHLTKGSPPRVAGAAPPPARRSRASRVVLGRYLAEAFRADEVRVDAVCFTAETLLWALNEVHMAVLRRELRPRSIELRCLVPGPDAELPYPRPVGRPDLAERVRAELRNQISKQESVMKWRLEAFAAEGIDARPPAFGALPFWPSEKLYLLNGALALQGRYHVGPRTYQLPGEGEFEVLDVGGFQAQLFEYRRGAPGQEGEAFQDAARYFEALWASTAERPTLGR